MQIRERLAHVARVMRTRHEIAGQVDRFDDNTVVGWAADLEEPGRRLVVECVHDGHVLGTAVADELRDDLQAAGIGDGRHGFRCTLATTNAGDVAGLSVQVRVRETGTLLNPAELHQRTDPFLWFIAADIVNNCNLRCPFCVVDYSRIKRTDLMTDQTFQNLLRLIYSVPDGQFYISCLHEPTLHPRLNDYLEMIPRKARRKVFFTTNLARPLTAAYFEAWARSGLHHINVSLDTLDKARFAVLRKFGRFEVFEANLNLMADVFRSTPGAPPIRYITMAFASNLDEIPRIVLRSRERWEASENEIRYTFNVKHITDEFRQAEYLHREDWGLLTERLNALKYPVQISYPPETGYDETIGSQNFDDLPTPGRPLHLALTRPLGLRVRPDGSVLVNGAEDALRVNINALADPVHFFQSLLRQARPYTDGRRTPSLAPAWKRVVRRMSRR